MDGAGPGPSYENAMMVNARKAWKERRVDKVEQWMRAGVNGTLINISEEARKTARR